MADGVGLLLPFQRDGRGSFATGTDDELLRSQVRLVLGTKGDSAVSVGELPWRTAFGAQLDVLRFQPLNAATVDLGRSIIKTAFERWLPEVVLVNLGARRDSEAQKLILLVSYRRRVSSDTYTETVKL